jgi:hypothetical protein
LAHDPKSDQTLLVWSALDQKKPHVFVTLVDAEGKKIAQRMLTSSAGEVYDSAAVPVGDGWVVAWVDTRSGAPRAYSTKIDNKLARKSPDQPVGTDEVSGLSLAMSFAKQGNDIALLYAQQDASTGGEVIQLTHVSSVNAATVGPPVRVSSGARHAHSPELASTGSSLLAVWLEDESSALSAPSFLMWNSVVGGVDSRPKQVAINPTSGSVASAALACATTDCRLVVLTHGEGQRVVLLGGKIAAGSSTSPTLAPLAELGAGGAPSAPCVVGSSLFVADTSRAGRGWVRHLSVQWQ